MEPLPCQSIIVSFEKCCLKGFKRWVSIILFKLWVSNNLINPWLILLYLMTSKFCPQKNPFTCNIWIVFERVSFEKVKFMTTTSEEHPEDLLNITLPVHVWSQVSITLILISEAGNVKSNERCSSFHWKTGTRKKYDPFTRNKTSDLRWGVWFLIRDSLFFSVPC